MCNSIDEYESKFNFETDNFKLIVELFAIDSEFVHRSYIDDHTTSSMAVPIE